MKFKNLITTITLSIVSFTISTAQNRILSYEIGINYYGFKGASTLSSIQPNGGFSPYLGVTLNLPESKYPISIGLRANMFKLDLSHNNPNPQIRPDEYIFSHSFTFVQVQMPIAYNWTIANSEISTAISPSLYFNTHSNFNSTLPQSNDPSVKDYSTGISYIQPQKATSNIDLSIAYTYYITQLGNQKLGIKAYASYPLLNSIATHTTYDYSIEYKNGDKIAKSTSITDNYAPFSLGIGLILK